MPTTILAVDDSATLRKALEITFAGTEFNLVTCDSADAAMAKLNGEKPELVIVDVSLPPTDGYALLANIKAASPSVPVLMLSSRHNPFDPAKGGQADSHIDKPFDTQALQDRARELTAAGAAKPAAAPVAAARPPAAAAARPVAEPAAAVQKGGAAGPALTPRAAAVTAAARPAGPVATRMGPFAPPGAAAAGAGTSPTFKDTMPMPGRAVQDAAATARANLAAARPAGARPLGMGPGGGPSRSPFGPRPAAEPVAPKPSEPGLRGRPASGTLPGVPLGSSPSAARTKEPRGDFKRTTVSSWPAPPPKDEQGIEVNVPTTPKLGRDMVAAAAADAGMPERLAGLGLTPEQVDGVLALSRDIVEKVVWEVVPVLAETLIKEEIARLTAE